MLKAELKELEDIILNRRQARAFDVTTLLGEKRHGRYGHACALGEWVLANDDITNFLSHFTYICYAKETFDLTEGQARHIFSPSAYNGYGGPSPTPEEVVERIEEVINEENHALRR